MTDALSTPDTESTRGQLGQGIYSLADLRLYLAYFGDPVDGDRALQWLEAALNPVAHQPRRPDYSFSDLVSLFVVRELVRHGVDQAAIRESEAHMRLARGVDRPFVSNDIATDGHTVFFANEEPSQVEVANRRRGQRRGQQASTIVLAPYLRRVRYSDHGMAASWSPSEQVVLDPLIQFGDPVVEGTRVPTQALADLTRRSGLRQAAEWLGVSVDAAEAAVRFERELAALRN